MINFLLTAMIVTYIAVMLVGLNQWLGTNLIDYPNRYLVIYGILLGIAAWYWLGRS